MFYTPHTMRYELLKALYLHAQARPEEVFSESELEHEFSVSPIQFDLVVDWLVQRGYATCAQPAGHLAITERGVAEMEARGEYWQRERDAILDWLESEKARIASECAADPACSPTTESRLKMAAVEEARERRKALEARMRNLSEPLPS